MKSWNEIKYTTDAKYYPYKKVNPSFYSTYADLDLIQKVIDYLLDMPSDDYTPPDDNSFPRVRLWKYLYYDNEYPLQQPLPNPTEKKSVLYNANEPNNANFRIIPLSLNKEAEEKAKTCIYIFKGSIIASSDMRVDTAIYFNIWTHYSLERNIKTDGDWQRTKSRTEAIEQALIEALHGVNIGGVGSFYFDRSQHRECGSVLLDDGKSNVGRGLRIGVSLMGADNE